MTSRRKRKAPIRREQFREAARIFYTLGDRTRLAILTLLTEGEMNVTALCGRLKLPQSTVSHHLNLMLIGGVVKNRREGKQNFYSRADLAKHRLASKVKQPVSGTSARFGPAVLFFPAK